MSNDNELEDGFHRYEMFCQKVNKSEGVLLSVVLGLKNKGINNMSAVIDNLFTCLTTEINIERAENIIAELMPLNAVLNPSLVL